MTAGTRPTLPSILPAVNRRAIPVNGKPRSKLTAAIVQAVLELGQEGVIAKREDSLYEPGERGWLKLKLESQHPNARRTRETDARFPEREFCLSFRRDHRHAAGYKSPVGPRN